MAYNIKVDKGNIRNVSVTVILMKFFSLTAPCCRVHREIIFVLKIRIHIYKSKLTSQA